MCAESPEGAEVRLCLNAIWEKSDVILMSIDNWEEEWARRHDIRLNGQVRSLECKQAPVSCYAHRVFIWASNMKIYYCVCMCVHFESVKLLFKYICCHN